MSDLDQRFEQAAVAAKNLPQRPDNDTLLELYALYKQGQEGDVSGKPPSLFDFVAKAKYDAWAGLQGTPQETAKEKYIAQVEALGGQLDTAGN